jgi:hypothetical protein
MELYFSDELQKRIYDLVPRRDYKWLVHAVEYTKRARRGYPEDFEAWTDEVTIDHIMYYIDLCRMAQRDATMDDLNIVAAVNIHTQQNPCRIRPPVKPENTETEQAELPEEVKRAMESALEKTAEVLSEGELVDEEPTTETSKKKVAKKKATKKKAKKKTTKKKVSKKK